MSPNQPDAPDDFLGIDWAALEASVANSLGYTGCVPEYPTASPDPNLMFPGLDQAWIPAPTQHNHGHSYPARSHVTSPVPYTEPVPTPSLELIFDYGTPTLSPPCGASAYPSPAPLQLPCYTTPAPSHVPVYPSPTTSYNVPTPSSPAQPSSAFSPAYVSPYSSPSRAAQLHNPANNQALHHLVPLSLGPNRIAHTKSSVRSKPYVRTPSVSTKMVPTALTCPLTNPNYDWDALKSPTAASGQGLADGSIFGWAKTVLPSSVTPVHPTPGHMAQTEPVVQSAQTLVLPWQVVPSNDFQPIVTSAASESGTSSPAPSLSFLQAEMSPAAPSPSPVPLVLNPEESLDPSTVLATMPTKPTFPALVPGVPSTPMPVPVLAPVTSPMIQGTLTPASTPMVTRAPMPVAAPLNTPKHPVTVAPPRPVLVSSTVSTHSKANTAITTTSTIQNPVIPTAPEQLSLPGSLSAFAADEPPTRLSLSTPSPNLVAGCMPLQSSLASIPTLASAHPVSELSASNVDGYVSTYNISQPSAPLFTWPAAPTAPAMSYSADNSVGLGLELDDVDMDIALAAGIHLGDTGFQSVDRLSEISNNPSNPFEQLIPKQNQVRRGKRVPRPKMKWNGSLGGELTNPQLSQKENDPVRRWTFSEKPIGSLNASNLDATHRTPGDIHFSPSPEFPESGPEFVTWVAVRASETRVQWIEWQEGHPHPVFTGYVLRPARLAHSNPPGGYERHLG
ncbi:hypothetical protein RhiJN_08015 [Ceratobasidium sp. AG-Ba]|nr:hypothetical protein RhiJN_08015 [Ceratobasidium sp. AG-Ba]